MAAARRQLDELELLTADERVDGADSVPAITIEKSGQVGVGNLDLASIIGDGCEGHQCQPTGAGGARRLEDALNCLQRHSAFPGKALMMSVAASPRAARM